MKILANRDIKQLFCRIAGICLFFWLLTEGIVWHVCHQIRLIGGIAVLFALMFGMIAETCWTYFSRQNRLMEEATAKVQAFLDSMYPDFATIISLRVTPLAYCVDLPAPDIPIMP